MADATPSDRVGLVAASGAAAPAARGPLAHIFAERCAIEPRALIAIFHRWIQSDRVPLLQLFDVADYSHLDDGPVVLLVTGLGFLSLDRTLAEPARMSLLWRRRGGELPAFEGLREAAAIALDAAIALEGDAGGAIAFAPGEITVGFDDRLNAPGDAAGFSAFSPQFEALGRELYGAASVERAFAAGGGLRARITGAAVSLAELRARLTRASGIGG